MKTIFLAPTRRRIFLVCSRLSGLPELSQAVGLPTQQLPASLNCQASQGILLGNQRFVQAQ